MEVTRFEEGCVWHDIQALLEARLQLNIADFLSPVVGLEELRALQASSNELLALLNLPLLLKEAISNYKKNEERQNAADS